ncbi:polysaccharide deacetylase family protein, PEP-CTERM locus subfamily [Singulisphaera sp. GP187]|uniref:XrtA system polysaccharide deacetylase n=1 Tax=Singulisphaera sp. GP187 TaxID=1882752 RepID=UPI00092CD936|nr:XrtA system polysaccharide deacetylase [Singulisphaera sp. GP187]SIN67763.1 polysaccharide deacetylase family protein, PEP-CTERM locus subfamily [Singulisphaera sp. GP187]
MHTPLKSILTHSFNSDKAEGDGAPVHEAYLDRSLAHGESVLDVLDSEIDSQDVWDDRQRPGSGSQVILSFDVEEHFRIEAAAGLKLAPGLKAACRERLAPSTRWILDQLEAHDQKATFFILGQIAQLDPTLVRDIHEAGHEVASHGWDHRRVLELNPASFREDVRKSKDALEQVIGEAVVGYRAPTFSIVRRTDWALDVLAELGMLYDSSIYPVRHDRYGVPRAPRSPFLARGRERQILELPPATLRLGGVNAPIGGGGYFRLLPLFLMEWGLAQIRRDVRPAVAMLYFHPWEFDPGQPRLPLQRASRFRTYVGISRSQARLVSLLSRYRFARAVDVACRLDRQKYELSGYSVAE